MMTTRQSLNAVAEALRRNNMESYVVDTADEVVPLLKKLLHTGNTVAVGGSRTLDELGVIDLLRGGDYQFLDRYAPDLTREQVTDLFRRSFSADTYLCSSNAVTLRGELYNVDGNGNRIAAMCFGPRSVIVVVGCNKVVADLKEAEKRVKTVAAPLNAKRLHCTTYCHERGECMGKDGEWCTDGCASSARICCTYMAMGYQREAGRIKVILVGESLGF